MNNLKLADFKHFHPIATTLTSQVISAHTKDNPPHLYVLKKIEKETLKKHRLDQAFQKNLQTLSIINDPHFLTLLNHFEDKKNVYLLFEHQNFVTLHSVMHSLSEQSILKIFRQILHALNYIHQSHVPHFNIKLKSILLTEDHKVKLSDFGWLLPAKIEIQKKKSVCESIEQWAPEILLKQSLSEKVFQFTKLLFQYDVWCLGVVIYYALLKRSPFHSILTQYKGKKMMEKLQQEILQGQIDYSELPTGPKELIAQMLIREQSARISVQNILKHWWVNGYKEKPQSLLVEPETEVRKRSFITMKPLASEEELEYLNSAQEKRWKRRSQMDVSQISGMPGFHQKLEKAISADNAGQVRRDGQEDEDDGKRLRRQVKIIEEEEETKEEAKDDQVEEELVVVEAPQRKSLAEKVREKKQGQQPVESCGEVRGRGKTQFQVLSESKKESKVLCMRNVEVLREKRDELRKERDELQSEKVLLEVELEAQVPESSLKSLQQKYVEFDPAELKLLRQSTVTYYNYDSTTKQQYMQLLLSKLPQLRTEKFCLKQQKVEQLGQIATFPAMAASIEKLERELEGLQSQKGQYQQVMGIMERQKNEIVEKKNIMWLEVCQIYNDDLISQKIDQYEKGSADHSRWIPFLHDLEAELESTKLRRDESPSLMLTPLLEKHCSSLQSPSFVEEEQKWQKKLQQLEGNYWKQKEAQEVKMAQLLEENAKLKEKVGRKGEVEELLAELTERKKEVSGLNSSVLEHENQLRLDLRIIEDKLDWLKQYHL